MPVILPLPTSNSGEFVWQTFRLEWVRTIVCLVSAGFYNLGLQLHEDLCEGGELYDRIQAKHAYQDAHLHMAMLRNQSLKGVTKI